MRRAPRLDANHLEVVRALRAAGCAVWSTAALGGGFPDLVVFHVRCGVRLLEVKDGSKPPSARRLTDDERDFGRLFPVAVVLSPIEALAACGLAVLPEQASRTI